METQKIANLLNDTDNKSSDAYILVTGDKTATNGNRNTNIAFENCATAQLYKMCNSYK